MFQSLKASSLAPSAGEGRGGQGLRLTESRSHSTILFVPRPSHHHRNMDSFQWLFDYWKYPAVKCWTKGVDFAKNTGAWVHQKCNQYPCTTLARKTVAWFKRKHNEYPWIWVLLKRIGVALTIIAGFYGLYLTRQGNQLTRDGNHGNMQDRLREDQAHCFQYFHNLTETDQRSCNKLFRVDVITSVHELIVDSGAAITSWLHAKYTALAGFCGIYSVAERANDTCVGLGLFLAMWFLSRSHSLQQTIGRKALNDMLATTAALIVECDHSVTEFAILAWSDRQFLVGLNALLAITTLISKSLGPTCRMLVCGLVLCLQFYVPVMSISPVLQGPKVFGTLFKIIQGTEGPSEPDVQALKFWLFSLSMCYMNTKLFTEEVLRMAKA